MTGARGVPIFAMAATMLAASGCCLNITSGDTTSPGNGSASGTGSSGGGVGAGATTSGTGSGGSPVGVGPCSSNDQCLSGICGIDGIGNCCNSACTPGLPPCGATDCDGQTGACVFPGPTVGCGGPSCEGTFLTEPGVCSGTGTCATSMIDCWPYACENGSCSNFCDTEQPCAGNYTCDQATCCPSLVPGGTLYADSVLGSDAQPCCGIAGFTPCQTILQAMQRIDASSTPDVIIRATVAGDGGNWSPPGEVYPMVLGWGAELNAPGVYFTDRGNLEIIDVTAFSANDHVGYASIGGSADSPIWIGMDADDNQSTDDSAIMVEAGATLYVANATVNGNATLDSCQDQQRGAAITVNGDATLLLGQDHSASAMGTVHIGGDGLRDGCIGIACPSTGGIVAGCTIADVDLGGNSSVVIQGQEAFDVFANYSRGLVNNISLRSKPIFGAAPSQAGFGQCSSKRDGTGVFAGAPTHITFENGTVQCIVGPGFLLPSDSPLAAGASLSLALNNTTIQNTEIGIDAEDGIVTVTNSTFQFNHVGVYADANGPGTAVIDLSGTGAEGGRNTVVCNGAAETPNPKDGLDLTPGIGVLNMMGVDGASPVVNANNVDWDTPAPDLFMCTRNDENAPGGPCICELDGGCTRSPGADGMDAVYTSTGMITTAGNGLSPIICGLPDGG